MLVCELLQDRKGNVKPEEEWPTDEYWRKRWSFFHGSEQGPDPGSVTHSDDEEEPQSCLKTGLGSLTRQGTFQGDWLAW